MTFQDRPLQEMPAHPEGGGLPEDHQGEGVCILDVAEGFQNPSRTPLFHYGRRERRVECSCREDGLESVCCMFRSEVIEIGAEFDHLVVSLG